MHPAASFKSASAHSDGSDSDLLDLVDSGDDLSSLKKFLKATTSLRSICQEEDNPHTLFHGKVADADGLGPTTLVDLLHVGPSLVECVRIVNDEVSLLVLRLQDALWLVYQQRPDR